MCYAPKGIYQVDQGQSCLYVVVVVVAVLVVVWLVVFQDKVSLCSLNHPGTWRPGCQTHMDPPAFVSQVLKVKAWATAA